MTTTETTKLARNFRPHTHVCYSCGADFSPYWQSCQRCGGSHPVEKEDYNPISPATKKAEVLKK